MIVKEQEEMKYYNDDKSDVSSPTSPTSPVEKVPLGRLGSGLFSSIQRDSEERGITSPITKKPIFTLNDVQEADTSNDIGPPGSLVSEDKPWYETDSSEQLPKSVAATAAAATTAKQPHSNYKNASKASLNYRKREHIYESIDDVLAELRQNQGASPNYATLHKWTSQLTTPGSTSSSSSGSAALDTKVSSSQVSSRSSDEHDFTTKSTGDSTGNISSVVVGERRHSKSSSRPNSGTKERKSHSYSTSNVKISMQDGSHTSPPLVPITAAAAVTSNQPLSNDITTTTTTTHVRKHKKMSFPDVTIPNAPSPSPAKHSRQISGPEVQNSNVAPDVMVRSQSARWVRQRTHQPGRSQSPTVTSPSKDGYYTPQLPRSAQNGVQQSSGARYPQNDEYNPLAEENSISLNFSNEVLSMFNFQQQSYPPPPIGEKHTSRTASSSSTSTHGRRSVPLKPSPSPDLCVNPLGGPRISPPLEDNQPSTFCHVPRRQSGNTNLPNYKSTGDSVLSKLSAKRSISIGGSQNNLLNDLPADYHPANVQHRNNSIPSYHNMPPSPSMLSSDVTKRDIVDCTSSPRFPRRSLTRSPGQTAVFKGANPQGSQPRIAKFTAPPPPTVAPPPKLHQQYPTSDFRPPMGGHVRPPAKVEQTWC